MNNLQGYFKSKYGKLQGRSWIRNIDPEDMKAFMRLNLKKSNYGRTGGKIRAITSKRDNRGRFIKEK